MPEYHAPGVYVEEIQSGARPITAVGTGTAGFVGYAPNASEATGTAIRIGNWQQFVKAFMQTDAKAEPRVTHLASAVYGFFQNGGSTCYVVSLGAEPDTDTVADISRALGFFETVDDVAIVAAPGFTDRSHYDALLAHCEKMKDRFAILDAPNNEKWLDEFFKDDSVGPRVSDGGFGALYFPWIKTSCVIPAKDGSVVRIDVPTSGHIAGIYARVDGSIGVHKAPANEQIIGALDLTHRLTQDEIGSLNDRCVNSIKFCPGGSVRVWGARTVAGSSSQWKYVNVRRLFSMIEESIAKSTTWVVFQPNDFTLWNSIIRDVSAFLAQIWRQGALQGARPEEAFYVKCDRETNPQEVIDAGRVIIEIGIAPVKPAEFVVFRIGQSESGSEKN